MKLKLTILLLAMGIVISMVSSSNIADYWSMRKEPAIDFNKIDTNPVFAPTQTTKTQPLRLAVASVFVPHDLVQFYRLIVGYLGKAVGHPVTVVQRQSYTEVSILLERKEADLAFVSPGEYANYINSGHKDLELLVMQERNGRTTYQSLIVVPQNSKIENLGDLKGKTFAFADPLSFSGYLAAVYLLQQNQGSAVVPDTFFSRYMFTYNHSKSLRAVADHVVDGASIDSATYEDALRREPGLAEAVRIIAVSPKTGTGSIVVRRELDSGIKAKLQESFLHMDEDAEMKSVLKGLLIDRFVLPQPEAYEEIRKILREMGTTP